MRVLLDELKMEALKMETPYASRSELLKNRLGLAVKP